MTKNLKLLPTLTLLCVVPLAAACTEDTVSVAEMTETPVATTGGQALSAGGELTLVFKANTLSQDGVVVIRTERDSTDTSLVSPVFDLSVTPAVQTFEPPVELELKVPANRTSITLVNLDGAEPVAVEGAFYDEATGILTAQLTHFSRYAARSTQPAACPGSFPVGGSCTDEGLRCEYGQECCCGQCNPANVATCSGGSWAGLATDACLNPICPDAGPLDMNTPDMNTPDMSTPDMMSLDATSRDTPSSCPAQTPSGSCSDEGLRCEYGQECCCGECHPSIVANCSTGSWAVFNTDACFAPQCPDAGPADVPDADVGSGQCPPSFPSGGMCSDEGLRCEYGEECCCGSCFPSLVATCSGGSWAGRNTDACLGPCPDAGSPDD